MSVPMYIEEGIALLGALLAVEEGAENPTENTGIDAEFTNKTFAICPDCWCDPGLSPGLDQPPNFKYDDIEVRWYKNLGRDMEINREVGPEEWRLAMVDCLQSLGRR